MNRLDFLRIIGLATVVPSVPVMPENEGIKRPSVAIKDFKPKRWPIYPEVTSFEYKEGTYVITSLFTYVKINRKGKDYLIPVRERRVGDDKTKDRFEWMVNQTLKEFEVGDELKNEWFKYGLIIKYDPNIHNC